MKALFIGIFIIFTLGVFYFTVQIVKSPQFKTTLTLGSRPLGNTEGVGDEGGVKIFMDMNNSLSFVIPKSWQQVSPERVPYFSPLVQAGTGAYIMVANELKPYTENSDSDIEAILTEIPTFISQSVDTLAGEKMQIQAGVAKKTTFKNGIPGFKIMYTGKTKGDVLVPQYVKGNIYAYYVRGGILFGHSVHIATEESVLIEKSTSETTSFLQEANIVFEGLQVY